MFGSVTERRDFAEDSIDSPFADLDLLREVPGPRGNFVLNKGDKSSLPDEILAGACLDYLRKLGLDQRTHSLGGLARGEGSPGRVFALTESAIADALGRFSERSPWVALSDVAGARQLLILDDPQVALADIITSFYSKRRGSR
jgi:hypothetical protein